VFGLLGPNGAGKTTLFSIVSNFLNADSGRVEVLGVDTRNISRLRGRMTILPQDAQFQRNVPILEQLTFFRMLDGQDRASAEDEVRRGLELVGLSDYTNRSVRALSHGMLKRLGIAQAFLGEPEVILLDEPTSGLDPANARQIRDLVTELKARATVVVSSHNLDEIQELCSHVVILDRGQVVADGSVDELTRAHRELELRLSRTLDAGELERLGALDPVSSITAGTDSGYIFGLDLDGRDWDSAVAEILGWLLEAGVVPRRLTEGRSLESHFLQVTESAEP
jgi:ABC-type multidrug transport system ATPase subunit